MSVTIHVAGLAELQRKLLELPNRVNRRVVRHAVSDGAAIVRDEVKARAPVFTGDVSQGHPPPGTLKKMVYMKYINERSGPTKTVFYVGVRHGKKYQHWGKKDRNIDAYYFKFVEFGTVKMAAQPFLRPAFDTKKMAALDAIKAGLASGISAETASL